MERLEIEDVTKENIEDLCRICIPPTKKDDPDWAKGVEEKKKWVVKMLQKHGAVAKLAYKDDIPVGMIQYKPIPEERIVYIDCIYVPWDKYWRKGIATQLLSNLMEYVKKPLSWFDNKRPLAIVTKTFPAEAPGQYSARKFFRRKGFKQIGEDPDYLYYPLESSFVYQPIRKKEVKYIPQEEDKGKVLIICGPNRCPAVYPCFLKRMEKYIREVDPKIPIRWLDKSEEPDEVKKRNIDIGDCIVNAKHIKSFVLDKENFQKEVREALETT
jgi:RimJ/RimL family protein N-acetyltransferase